MAALYAHEVILRRRIFARGRESWRFRDRFCLPGGLDNPWLLLAESTLHQMSDVALPPKTGPLPMLVLSLQAQGKSEPDLGLPGRHEAVISQLCDARDSPASSS